MPSKGDAILEDSILEVAQPKRSRRVIVSFDESLHSLLEATACLGGYDGIEEYARTAILERFEQDRERCRVAMERADARKTKKAEG